MKRHLILWSCLCLALALSRPLLAACAPALDSSSGPFGGQAGSVTWSHTVGAGLNRALVVGVVCNGGASISSVMYGAQALTQQISLGDAGNQQHVFVYTLLNPASGSNSITVTFSGAPIYVCGAQSFAQVGAVGAINSSTTAAFLNTGSLTTTQPGSFIAGVVSAVNNQNTTFTFSNTSGQSTAWSGTGANGARVNGEQFSYLAAGAGPYSITTSFVPGTGVNIPASSVGLVELIPSCSTPTPTFTITPSPSISPTFTISPIHSPTNTFTPAPANCVAWTVNEYARVDASGTMPGKVILTGDNLPGFGSPMAGEAWSPGQTLDLSSSFSMSYQVYLGNDPAGTAGMAFVLQQFSNNFSTNGTGKYLGFGGATKIPGNSLEVELRTESTAGAAVNGTTAIDLNASIVPAFGPVSALSGGANIKDGKEHALTVAWDVSAKVLSVFIDGSLRMAYPNDLIVNVFGNNPLVYWGFTGSTDSTGSLQYFYDPNCVVQPSICTLGWVTAGSAAFTAPTKIVLTPPNTNWLTAAAWSPICVNVTQPFDFNYQVYLGSNPPTGGADGICFVLQTGGTSVLGQNGGNLGIAGITPSVAVKIDTYNDGAPDLPVDHIGVVLNGNLTTMAAGPVQASATQANIKDGALHTFEVKWDGVNTMSIYFDNAVTPRLVYSPVNLAALLGQTCVTYGFTAATGGLTDEQYFIDQNCLFTRTPTPTSTNTASLFSPTSTPTKTSTRTATPSHTPTLSFSPTPTSTLTATPSSTPSATVTVTVTSTLSSTRSSTPTPSQSSTLSSTPTRTPSLTVTGTATPSSTQSPPFSATSTPTITLTRTASPSFSPSPTFSASPSFSFTSTDTPSLTLSPSVTITNSFTGTPSQTPSSTVTDTATPSLTLTSSLTSSPTLTVTDSFTVSPTFSPSPTATQSPVPVPFRVNISVYNSAGELVKTVYSGPFAYSPAQISLSVLAFVPGLTQLQMPFGSQLVSWAGDNDQGQWVKAGVYYVKVEIKDPFGKISALSEAVSVLPPASGSSLALYNSAGELVAHMSLSGYPEAMINFSLAKSVYSLSAAGASAPVLIPLSLKGEHGNSYPLIWNAVGDRGQILDSGTYMLELVDESQGRRSVYSKQITLLASPKGPITVVMGPNPLPRLGRWVTLSFPNAAAQPRALAKVFNLAGELVAMGSCGGSTMNLDMGGAGEGIYIVDFELNDAGQLLGRKRLKLAVLH